MKSSAKKVELASVDDLFSTEESRADARREKVVEIPLSELHSFKGHPFKVKDDDAMMETADSIRQYGVLVPAIARPDPEGGYELVAGHRRHRASELAEKETMPVIVRDLDDDAATIIMVEKLILTAIREVSAYVREDEKEFIRIVRDAASAGQEQTAREQKKRLRQVEKRIGELDELIKKLYEGNATGKIPDKHFNRLLAEYDTEQSALEQEAAELKEGITAQAEDGMRAQRFVSLVRRYTSFDELTAPMLNEFIEKVVVHEADKSTGDRRQKVDIYFNFIGCFVPPKPEVILTAEEEAKAQKALAARNREREQNKLRMRRVREAQRAARIAISADNS